MVTSRDIAIKKQLEKKQKLLDDLTKDRIGKILLEDSISSLPVPAPIRVEVSAPSPYIRMSTQLSHQGIRFSYYNDPANIPNLKHLAREFMSGEYEVRKALTQLTGIPVTPDGDPHEATMIVAKDRASIEEFLKASNISGSSEKVSYICGNPTQTGMHGGNEWPPMGLTVMPGVWDWVVFLDFHPHNASIWIEYKYWDYLEKVRNRNYIKRAWHFPHNWIVPNIMEKSG